MINKRQLRLALDALGGDTLTLEELRELAQRLASGSEPAAAPSLARRRAKSAELKSLRRWLNRAGVRGPLADRAIVKRAGARK